MATLMASSNQAQLVPVDVVPAGHLKRHVARRGRRSHPAVLPPLPAYKDQIAWKKFGDALGTWTIADLVNQWKTDFPKTEPKFRSRRQLVDRLFKRYKYKAKKTQEPVLARVPAAGATTSGRVSAATKAVTAVVQGESAKSPEPSAAAQIESLIERQDKLRRKRKAVEEKLEKIQGRLSKMVRATCIHAEEAPTVPLEIEGAAVRLHSLNNAPELNGKTGVCSNFNAHTGRWTVALNDGAENDIVYTVKPANLEVLKPVSSNVVVIV